MKCQNKVNLKIINPIAFRTAKTLWSFGRGGCKRVKVLSKLIKMFLDKINNEIFVVKIKKFSFLVN